MAPGLKLGDHVQAEAVAVLGSRKAGDVFGPWALLHGLVVDVIGCGRQRKFKVKWDKCACEAVLSACSLEREVLMSATEETESSGSDEEEIHNPEMGDPE